jgi:hypothetical protein
MTNPVVNSDIELREPEILLPGSKYLWRKERDIGSCSFPQCHKKPHENCLFMKIQYIVVRTLILRRNAL